MPNDSLQEQILSQIEYDTNSGCWFWNRPLREDGYGSFVKIISGKREQLAHRVSYFAFCGELLPKKSVLHHCDVRACCNPDHLYLGTHKDNTRDMWARGRGHAGKGETAHHVKLMNKDVDDIRASHGIAPKVLAQQYGVHLWTIYKIRQGVRRAHDQ